MNERAHVFLLTSLILITSFCSCSQLTQRTGQLQSQDENWVISNRTVSRNKYSIGGLLDTTYERSFMYINGQFLDSSESITARKYDNNNNLISEEDFSFSKEGKKIQNSEIIRTFDSNDRLQTNYFNLSGTETDKDQYRYDKSGFTIQAIFWRQHVEKSFENPSIQKTSYDTSISSFINDKEGNHTTVIIMNRNRDTLEISHTFFVNKQKISSYTIDRNADTTYKYVSLTDGNYIKEITEFRSLGMTDTTWLKKGKIVKRTDHGMKRSLRHKTIYKYDSKGNEIESISYSHT